MSVIRPATLDEAALLRLGFDPLPSDKGAQDPLRCYLTVPLRTEKGWWLGLPLFTGPLPEDPAAWLRLADERLRARYRLKQG